MLKMGVQIPSRSPMKNLGIDIGHTIVGSRIVGDRYHVESNCFEVVAKLVAQFDNTYLVSKVNSTQRERSLQWLKDSEFFTKTGIKQDNLYYCFDRRDKAIFVRALDITHFIDDRAEVLYHLDEPVNKYLFNPENFDVAKYGEHLKNTTHVSSWTDIEKLLCGQTGMK